MLILGLSQLLKLWGTITLIGKSNLNIPQLCGFLVMRKKMGIEEEKKECQLFLQGHKIYKQ